MLEKVEMGAETYCANVQETGTCLSIFALTTFILKHNLNTLNFFESSGMVYWRLCSDLWILLVFLFCSVLSRWSPNSRKTKKNQRTQWNTINAFTALAECLGSSDLGTLGSLFHELNTYCWIILTTSVCIYIRELFIVIAQIDIYR